MDGRDDLARLLAVSNGTEWDFHPGGNDVDDPYYRDADAILHSDWLAERVRLAQEQAWNEGHEAGRDYQGDGWNSDLHDPQKDNPYTQGDKQA